MYNDILIGLQMLAGVCDGACSLDNQGFNKYDSNFGHSLASKSSLTNNQARVGKTLIIKYQNQLPGDLVERVKDLVIEIHKRPTPSIQEALDSLQWSTPKLVKNGTLELMTAEPTQTFRDSWKAHKNEFQSSGYSFTPFNGHWNVNKWNKVGNKTEEKKSDSVLVLPEIPEHILPKLLAHQPPVVQYLTAALQEYNSALDASETGIGKTHCALATAKILGMRVLAIVKKAAIPSWQMAAEYQEVECDVINIEQIKTGKTCWGDWIKTPIQNSKGETNFVDTFEWTVPEYTLVVIDECHILKNSGTQNAQLAINARLQGLPLLLMSATAASNPLEMRALGFILNLFPLKNYWNWAAKHGVKKGRFGMEFTGEAFHLQQIHNSIFRASPIPKGVRVRTKDVPNFPDTLICPEAIDFDGNNPLIQTAYDEMEQEIAKLKDRMGRDAGACILTEILRARQKVELLKVPALVEMANDLVQEGNSVVIFVSFKESIASLVSKLKTTCIIDGDHTGNVREENRLRFQRGSERICICSILAGESIDLDDQIGDYPRVSLINPDFSSVRLYQAMGRIHRAKSLSKSIQKICFAAGTVEDRALNAIRRKSKNGNLINDGDLSCGLTI